MNSLKKLFVVAMSFMMLLTMMPMATGTAFAGNSNVAQIGGQVYHSLKGAIASATDGDEIVLLEDVLEKYSDVFYITIPRGKAITLDLNGNTIFGTSTSTGYTGLVHIENGGKLTVKDSKGGGTIKYCDEADNTGGATIHCHGSLEVLGGTIENVTNGVNSVIQAAIDVYPNEWGTLYNPEKLTLNISGGTIKSNLNNTIRLTNFSHDNTKTSVEVNMTGGTITGGADCFFIQGVSLGNMKGTVLNISDGVLDAKQPIRVFGAQNTLNETEDTPYVINISGGKFRKNQGAQSDKTFIGAIAYQNTGSGSAEFLRSYVTVNVTGGYYNYNGNNFASEGYECIDTPEADPNHETYPYMIGEKEPVVQIVGGEKYLTLQEAIASATDAETTIKMLRNNAEPNYVVIDNGKKIILDLAGKTYKGTIFLGESGDTDSFTTPGELKVIDSSKSKTGKITSDGSQADYTIYVVGSSKLTLDGVRVENTSNVLYKDVLYCLGDRETSNPYTLNADAKPTIIINNSVVESADSATKGSPTIFCIDGNLTIKGNSKIISKDGTAIQSLGTFGNNNIRIQDDAEIIGKSAGIYLPFGNLTITGGTISGESAAYVKGADKTIISGGTFIANGDVKAYEYKNSGFTPTGEALVVECCDFGSHGNPNVSISGGYFKSKNNDAVGAYASNGQSAAIKFVSGGYYSTYPTSKYIADGYIAVASDLPGYVAKVVKKTTSETEKVDTDITSGSNNVKEVQLIDEEQNVEAANAAKTAIESAITAESGIIGEAELAPDAASVANKQETIDKYLDTAKESLASDSNITYEESVDTVTIVIEPYYDIQVTGAKKEEASITSVTYEIDAKYNVLATTASNTDAIVKADGTAKNTVVISTNNNLTVTEPVTMTIPLPAGFAIPANLKAYIKHMHEGKEYVYEGKIEIKNDKYYVTFTNPNGFSTFTVVPTADTVASVSQNGSKVYFNDFQSAANYVVDGGILKLEADDAGIATVSRTVTITFETNEKTGAELKCGLNTTLTKDGNSYKFVYSDPNNNTGYGGGSIDYEQYKKILEEAQRQQAELDKQKEELAKNQAQLEEKEKVQAALEGLKIRANSKYAKLKGKYVTQVYVTVLEGNEKLDELKDAGYTFKYDYYRSVAKKNNYKKMLSKGTEKYYNTKGTRGKMYYYRAVLSVYDLEGNLVASTKLNQCKYGNRAYRGYKY